MLVIPCIILLATFACKCHAILQDFDFATACGNTHSCFHVAAGEPKTVAFRNGTDNNTIDFVLSGNKPRWLTEEYPLEAENWALTVGFNKSPGMPNTAIIACVYDGVQAPNPATYVYAGYAAYRKGPREADELTKSIVNSTVLVVNNSMICTFSLPRMFIVRNETFDLAAPMTHHILLARLYASGRVLGYHQDDKVVSQLTGLMSPVAMMLDVHTAPTGQAGHGGAIAAMPDTADNKSREHEAAADTTGYNKLSDVVGVCGHEAACVSLPRDCHLKDNGAKVDAKCDLLAVYSVADSGLGIEFTMFGRKPTDLTATSGWFMALGISPTPEMDHTIIILCIDNGTAGLPAVVPAYGYANGHPEIQTSALSSLLSEQNIRAGPTLLVCQFTTLNMTLSMGSVSGKQNVTVDLQHEPLYLLMARGAITNNDILYHGTSRAHTSDKVSLTEF